ncbi:Nicotinate phosphoribosyltransferase [Giardia duodenalis]|uniref:nicotinate phosphoribosyltransferase n=1 Tax=Giardia intestinalis TaxID=5741 RepID=V6T8V2_GIAIN|nr:Nicotinate phosphoribosyltransferase [Giardia intestinalis]
MYSPTPLLNDFYQYTMAYSYYQAGFANRQATFEMFFRQNPFNGQYAVFAGLRDLLDFILDFRFSDDDISYLKLCLPDLDPGFFDYLKTLSWRQLELYAPKEGTIVFAGEPVIIVRGPLLLCQLLESTLLVLINYPTLVCTKACRLRVACNYEKIMEIYSTIPYDQRNAYVQSICSNPVLSEFGLRRAQGVNGGICASEYAIMGGCNGTSNMYAARKLGILPVGTMAHSFVLSVVDTPEALLASLQNSDSMSLLRSKDSVASAHLPLSFENFVQKCMDWKARLFAQDPAESKEPEVYKATESPTNERLPIYPVYRANLTELSAFMIYAYTHPNSFVALIDTYDSLNSGLYNFLIVACGLIECSVQPRGVRLDSGDLSFLSIEIKRAFSTLDAAIRTHPLLCGKDGSIADCLVIASNDLDEEILYNFVKEGACIDMFGIGTHLVTCNSQPSLGGVYKLVELDGIPRIKFSDEIGKVTIPGQKILYRLYTSTHTPFVDLIARPDEEIKERQPVHCLHPHTPTRQLMMYPSKVEAVHTCILKTGEINYPHETSVDRERREVIKLKHPQVLDIQRYVVEQLLTMRPDHIRATAPTPYKISLTKRMSNLFKDVVQANYTLKVIE